MLTVKEASNKLSVEPASVRRYIRRGLISDETNPNAKQCLDLKFRERLKAIQTYNGRRLEYRIKNDDLEYYKKKYLTVNN